MSRRVVVTGLGTVTSIGHDTPTFWESCLSGKTNVATIPDSWRRYADHSSTVWSPLPSIDYEARSLHRMDLMQTDPVATLALFAAVEAVADAGLEVEATTGRQLRLVEVGPDRVGVAMGTGLGGTLSIVSTVFGHTVARPRAALAALAADMDDSEAVAAVLDDLDGAARVSPLAVAMIMPNSPASAISIKFSTTGPSNTYTSACAAGTAAIGHAFESIRSGRSDIVLAGGSESMYDPYGTAFRSFDGARTLASADVAPDQINRPFDRDRSGFLFSEGGAAVLVLEELGHARRRGVPIVAEIAGFAETSDAHNPVATAPDGRQIERAFREAVAAAGLEPTDIDYVNAHGTGTILNDDVESAMLERVVGKGPAINSTKSLLGHTLGASGAIEAVVMALSLRDQATHACSNLESPIRDLSFVIEAGPRQIDAALSESFAFGGHNAALVMTAIRN